MLVTFVPTLRCLEQAFGRAARRGEVGSGCLVLHTTKTNVLQLLGEVDETSTEAINRTFYVDSQWMAIVDELSIESEKCWHSIRDQASVRFPQLPLVDATLLMDGAWI